MPKNNAAGKQALKGEIFSFLLSFLNLQCAAVYSTHTKVGSVLKLVES